MVGGVKESWREWKLVGGSRFEVGSKWLLPQASNVGLQTSWCSPQTSNLKPFIGNYVDVL
jgi:hypothetical protein